MFPSAGDFAHEVSEFEMSGLTPMASSRVGPPLVKESAFQMECVLHSTMEVRSELNGNAYKANDESDVVWLFVCL